MKNRELLKTMSFFAIGLCSLVNTAQNPLSDPTNNDGWILNTTMSDEFNGSELDKTKWWILGENGDYRSKWKGRAPGQFASHNVIVDDGNLIIRSQWEPTFNFANEQLDGIYYGGGRRDDNSRPITQACVMSETFFKYGYMEVRAKIADAPVTSAFWTTGYHSEIDMVENYGKRPIGNPRGTNSIIERKQRTNMINWDPDIPSNHRNWKVENDMGIRLAEDYHVYGFEWDKDYIRTYFDGNLLRSETRQNFESNNQWRHDHPQELWLDSEVFYWYGTPAEADLVTPAEFKIDYVRIWQKEINGPSFNALGFEGPFYYQGRSTRWWNSGSVPWRIKNEKPASGDFSMRFQRSSPFSGNYTTFTPYGSLSLPAGNNELKFKIWIDPSTTVNALKIILENPWEFLNFDLTGVQKGEWVELSQSFSRTSPSNTSLTNGDRMRVQLNSSDIVSSEVLLYIDDFEFQNTLSVTKEQVLDFSLFPNPAKSRVTFRSNDNGKIHIYNISGILISTTEKQKESVDLDVSNLSSGVYIARFISNNRTAIKKIIIE
ncbi:T9SS type A sorting domain-containing protein [Cognatitamlana onchidii]|uniref:T9SS type A sorting domain-containing protein n=1 Tax=Cognatitamlana onchidii TaxID=2562860 RepID=UPI0010A6478D|nr:T9SS type A sorting domain-containing protein [Algibacter onchidii]